MMGEPVEQCGRHLGVAKDAGPFAEGEVGGDNDGSALVEAADQVEEELAAGLGKGQIAELIEYDEVEAGQVIGKPSLAAGSGLAFQAVDEVDDGVEAASGTAADTSPSDGNGKMALAGAVPPISTALRCSAMKPPVARSRTSASLIGVPAKSDSSRSLASGSLAMVSWYLIERA